MADTQSKELKVREKQEVASPAEQTTPGLVFTPAVDIFETEKDITLLADMPGVKADDLTIDLRDNTLEIVRNADKILYLLSADSVSVRLASNLAFLRQA